MVVDVHSLFVHYDKKYFSGVLGAVTVSWSKRMTLCAGVCRYRANNVVLTRKSDNGSNSGKPVSSAEIERKCIVATEITISLSEPLLTLRPESDTINTLLHEMIHAFLFIRGARWDENDHGPAFQKMMHDINRREGTSITVYHSFHAEVDYYRVHWWQCKGTCRRIVKRAMNRAPSVHDAWWAQHERSCGGLFEKIREPPPKRKKKKKSASTKQTESTSIKKDGKYREELDFWDEYLKKRHRTVNDGKRRDSAGELQDELPSQELDFFVDNENQSQDALRTSQTVTELDDDHDNSVQCPLCEQLLNVRDVVLHAGICNGHRDSGRKVNTSEPPTASMDERELEKQVFLQEQQMIMESLQRRKGREVEHAQKRRKISNASGHADSVMVLGDGGDDEACVEEPIQATVAAESMRLSRKELSTMDPIEMQRHLIEHYKRLHECGKKMRGSGESSSHVSKGFDLAEKLRQERSRSSGSSSSNSSSIKLGHVTSTRTFPPDFSKHSPSLTKPDPICLTQPSDDAEVVFSVVRPVMHNIVQREAKERKKKEKERLERQRLKEQEQRQEQKRQERVQSRPQLPQRQPQPQQQQQQQQQQSRPPPQPHLPPRQSQSQLQPQSQPPPQSQVTIIDIDDYDTNTNVEPNVTSRTSIEKDRSRPAQSLMNQQPPFQSVPAPIASRRAPLPSQQRPLLGIRSLNSLSQSQRPPRQDSRVAQPVRPPLSSTTPLLPPRSNMQQRQQPQQPQQRTIVPKIHNTQPSHPCVLCGKSFESAEACKQHMTSCEAIIEL